MENIIDVDKLKHFIVNCLEDKKAENVLVIDLTDKTDFARYMVFASGRSTRNVSAIADYVSLELKRKLALSVKIEAIGNSGWVLIDVGDIVVHVFYPETRSILNLEEKWM